MQQGSHFSKQLLRSGKAAAANYAEARGAESRPDFIHKLRIVLKELNETAVWLQLIVETCLLPRDKLVAIVAENEHLCRIIAASVKTAGGCRPKIWLAPGPQFPNDPTRPILILFGA